MKNWLTGTYSGSCIRSRISAPFSRSICPLQTLAIDFTKNLYGKASYNGYTPEQVLTGWMFYADDWMQEPMLRLKGAEMRDRLQLPEYVPVSQFFNMLTFISMKRHERMLLYLRADQKRLIGLGFASILVACVPGMLTVGMTMAYTLIFACLFPRKTKQLSPKTEEPKAESATSDAASQTNSDSHEEE